MSASASSTAPPPPSPTIITMGCLHGCNQTASMFQNLLKQFNEKAGKSNIRLVFLEAQYDHPLGGKTWYSIPLDVQDIGTAPLDLEQAAPTMELVDKFVAEHGVQVLLGFSQGANVVDTWFALRPDQQQVKTAVLLSGYSFVNTESMTRSCRACLNVTSSSDQVVKAIFAPTVGYPNVVAAEVHDKGHKIPTSKPQLQRIVDFIRVQTTTQ